MKAPWTQEHTDLLAMVVPHMAVIGEDECKHYLRTENRRQIPEALKRGFVLPSTITSAAPVAQNGYPIAETDYFVWLDRMEKFAGEHLGTKINLRELFDHPTHVPWQKCLPIFDPGLTDREMIDKALKARNIKVYEEKDVMDFSGAGASPRSRLQVIERSLTPTEAGMGLPPKFHQKWFAGRQTRPLHRRAYGIATSLHQKVVKEFLDPQTFTWFSENILPGGRVACGRWCGDRVRFRWRFPAVSTTAVGFVRQLRFPLNLKP